MARDNIGIKISIHPPLAGRDDEAFQQLGISQEISIHPPLAGRDEGRKCGIDVDENFNPPAPRGTGRISRARSPARSNFNPPAPRGTGLSNTDGDG